MLRRTKQERYIKEKLPSHLLDGHSLNDICFHLLNSTLLIPEVPRKDEYEVLGHGVAAKGDKIAKDRIEMIRARYGIRAPKESQPRGDRRRVAEACTVSDMSQHA